MWSPSLIEISQWRDSSQHWRAMSSLSWNGASVSSKSKQVRPAPSRAWIAPTKMPCMSDRDRSAAAGRSAAIFAGPVLRVARRAPRGSKKASSMRLRTKRSSRANSASGRSFFIVHSLSCLNPGFAQATRACDAARSHDQHLELALAPRRTLHLLGRIDQRLEQHLAVAPVFELVLEGELQGADRGSV